MKRLSVALLSLPLLAMPASTGAQALGQEPAAPDNRLSLEVGQKFFLYNLEGSEYTVRNARTLFGDILDARLMYRIGDNAKIRAGVVFILPMSEDDFALRWGDYYRDFRPGDHSLKRVNLVQPFVQMRYDLDRLAFIFGDLEVPHDYHPIVVYDVYEFLRPTEKGFQVLYGSHTLSQDLFINWRELNAPDRHERFNLGSMTKAKWEGGSAAFQFLYVHRGGTEFPQEPIVFENLSVAAVFDESIAIERSAVHRVGLELVPLFTSDLPPDAAAAKRSTGFGALGSLYVTVGDWRLMGGYWTGSDEVYAEEGLPFTKTGRFAYGEARFSKQLKHGIGAEFVLTAGAYGHGLDQMFFDQKIVVTWRHAFGLAGGPPEEKPPPK